MKGKKGLKRGERGDREKQKKKAQRKSTKLFVRIRLKERWLEDYSKFRFFNCGFIQNPVKINY